MKHLENLETIEEKVKRVGLVVNPKLLMAEYITGYTTVSTIVDKMIAEIDELDLTSYPEKTYIYLCYGVQKIFLTGSKAEDIIGRGLTEKNEILNKEELERNSHLNDIINYMPYETFRNMGEIVAKIFEQEDSKLEKTIEKIHGYLGTHSFKGYLEIKLEKESKELYDKFEETHKQFSKLFEVEFDYNLFTNLSFFIRKENENKYLKFLSTIKEDFDITTGFY